MEIIPIKYTFEEIESKFIEKGLHLLSENYINSKTKMDCSDKLGYKYSLSFSNVRDKRLYFHSLADPKNPFSIENIQHYININGGNCKIISNVYKNDKEKFTLKCSCGNTYDIGWGQLKNTNKFICNECARKGQCNKTKLEDSEVNNFLNSIGYELLDEYINSTSKITLKDKIGYLYYVTYGQLKIGNSTYMVHSGNPHSIHNIQLYLKQTDVGKDTIVLSKNYNSKSNKIKLKCSCEKIFYTTWNSIYSQNKYRCNICTQRKSNIEVLTGNYLKKLGLDFVEQHTFENCKFKRKLKFDVFIPSLNICLELNGQQHYNSVEMFGGEIAFEEQQLRDGIKREYCKNNNIQLIEIPHWRFRNENYKELIYTKLFPINSCEVG